jgi:hypothetical protein
MKIVIVLLLSISVTKFCYFFNKKIIEKIGEETKD